ncbi:hypothetical protein ACWEIJ_43990 [Lentzea sp. NPDC004789]
MSFEIHSDIAEHPVFAKLSLAAFGFWARAGSWTSPHHSPGFVPVGAIADLGDDEDVTPFVAELVKAGVWTEAAAGYRMEFGPSTDWPLPLWRYTP